MGIAGQGGGPARIRTGDLLRSQPGGPVREASYQARPPARPFLAKTCWIISLSLRPRTGWGRGLGFRRKAGRGLPQVSAFVASAGFI